MTNGTRWFWGTERVLEGTSLLVAPRARRAAAAGAAGATYLRSLCRSGRPQRSSWFGSLASRWPRGGSLAWPRSIGAKNNARDNARWQNEIELLGRGNAELDARTHLTAIESVCGLGDLDRNVLGFEDDEAEATRATREAVAHDGGLDDLAVLFKVMAQAVVGRVPRQTTDEELATQFDGGRAEKEEKSELSI